MPVAQPLGPISTSVRRRATPQQWRRIVQQAHRKGFSVESFLDASIPEPLKERTRASLVQQAKKTVATAYQPVTTELSRREQQIKAVDDKRARDNQYYLDWLNTKQAELYSNAAASDAALRDAGKQIQSATAQGYAEVAQAIRGDVAATPGFVSNPDQAKALDIAPEAKRAIDDVANLQRLGLNDGGGAHSAATASAMNFASAAAMEARRTADTWKSLQGVADDRARLVLNQGAETAKEIERLLNQEVSKAQARQDNSLVANRLGVQLEGIRARTRTALAQLRLNYAQLGETTRNHQAIEAIRRTANDIAQGRLNVAWYKAKHPQVRLGKYANPQEAFDTAYNVISQTPTYEVLVKGKTQTRTLTPDYVQKHFNRYVAAVALSAKVSRKMALRAVRAWLASGGAATDPGDYRAWGPTSPRSDAAGGGYSLPPSTGPAGHPRT